jgi:hypothetical protein
MGVQTISGRHYSRLSKSRVAYAKGTTSIQDRIRGWEKGSCKSSVLPRKRDLTCAHSPVVFFCIQTRPLGVAFLLRVDCGTDPEVKETATKSVKSSFLIASQLCLPWLKFSLCGAIALAAN